MKKIGFYLRKGGVGKTTMSVSVAFELAREGFNVCIIDCDTQGNASTWLLDKAQYELSDVLDEKTDLKSTLQKVRDNLFIVPTFGSTKSLKGYSETKLLSKIYAFEDLNEQLEKIGFDIIIYDLSPSFSLLENRIIKSLDEIVMVTQAEFFSFDGVEIFLDDIKTIQKDNKSFVKTNKVVINMLNQSFNRHKSFLKNLKNSNKDLSIFEVPQNSKVAESQLIKKDIFEYDPTNRVILPLQEIAKSLIGA